MGIFPTRFYSGNEQSYRYTRSADGRETWTPKSSSGPKDEMLAKYNGTCRLADCGDRAIVANETEIKKIGGAWNHKSCPKVEVIEVAAKAAPEGQNIEAALDAAVALRIADQADALLNEFEAGASVADRADALLVEYAAMVEAQAREARAAAHQQFMARKLVYRVSLHGEAKRYGIDVVDVQAVPNEKFGNVKIGEFRGEGVGRVEKDGRIVFWPNVDQRSARVQAVVEAVNILMNAADPIAYARAYATEAHQCMRCGDDLLDDQKNPYYPLLGPVCGRKFDKEV